jgi:glycosyltransferase involved in cell wall biosynthesis
MPYLIGACDIYAAPSRLEGFGMAQIEAGACAKPVLSIKAMGMLDTLVHGETAFLANVAQEIVLQETTIQDGGNTRRIVFDPPRIVEYHASVDDLADYLKLLMTDSTLREKMGEAVRAQVVKNFDYRVVAARFVEIIHKKLGIN